MRRAAAAGLLWLAPWMALAAPTPQVRAEIAGLMDALASSPCQFQRNGTWYQAARAREHLQRKYDHLLKKNLIDTTAQFIERAASRSSVSGRAYRVRCPGQPDMDAAPWFEQRLRSIRDGGTQP